MIPAWVAVLVILATVLCAASLAVRESWAKALFVVALILLAWTVVDGQQPPPCVAPAPGEPTPVECQPPPMPPPNTVPCTENQAESCLLVTMTIEGHTPRMFTALDFNGTDPTTIDETAVCTGRITRGAFRYYATGTTPSALVGVPVPYPPELRTPDGDINHPGDPEGTLEESGDHIRLYNRALIVGFKAMWADWAGAELSWECQL